MGMRFRPRKGRMRIDVTQREKEILDTLRSKHPELVEEPEKKKKTLQQWLDEPVLGG